MAAGEGEELRQYGMSKLAAGVLLNYADGDLSAVKVQYHAANAQSDGLDHPMIKDLAAIGEGEQNCQRGLLRLLDGKLGLTRLQTVIEDSHGIERTTGIKEKREKEIS